MAAIFSSLFKTVNLAGTAEALGASTVQFNCGVFIGRKSATVANTGSVWIKFSQPSSMGPIEIYPDAAQPINAPASSVLDAGQLYVDAETSGDGVLFYYTLANDKSFNDIEGKVEDAIKAYLLTIGATLDDCSFTSGIDDQERTADNINVYCQNASERIINSGVFDCTVTVTVRTAVAPSGDANKLDRHRLRTAYARDLILEPDAEQIIGSLRGGLTVYEDSIREVVCESRPEGKQWVSEMRFTITVNGSDLL